MSSSPSSPSSSCVRDALFLPDEALARLSLLVERGGVCGKSESQSKNAAELALVVRIGELAKRLDAALSLMRVWWEASLVSVSCRGRGWKEKGRNWSRGKRGGE
jgi:hypothetical protein